MCRIGLPVPAGFTIATSICDRYNRNGGKLPFGCHAWPRWDRAFWEPYLIAEGPS